MYETRKIFGEFQNYGYESIVHGYWKRFYATRFKDAGYQVREEVVRKSGRVDLLAVKEEEKIGIEIELHALPWMRIVEEVAKPETTKHMYMIWGSCDYPEALSYLTSRYHSKNSGAPNSSEWLLSDEIDAMLDEAARTIDFEERLKIEKEIQEKIVEMTPTVWLFDFVHLHAYQSGYAAGYGLLRTDS